MILADKIIFLRKQNGWSQEQLAEQLGVSRQSVSKWESSLSMPDLDKIMKMSSLFGVSTDYLLKDEIESLQKEMVCESDDEKVKITLEDANTYMDAIKDVSTRLALGIALCVLSPVPLMFLAGLTEMPEYSVKEDLFAGIGVSLLLITVAIGVAMIIVCSIKVKKWDFIEESILSTEYGVKGVVEKKKHEYGKTYRICTVSGVVLCIICAVPLVAAAGLGASDFVCAAMVDVLLMLVAAAVFLFVKSGAIQGSYAKLLQEGEYSEAEKKMKRRLETVNTVYWCSITAIYLLISFVTFAWDKTWIIWPVAAVFFAVVESIAKAVINRK